jgi:hypothetical protein
MSKFSAGNTHNTGGFDSAAKKAEEDYLLEATDCAQGETYIGYIAGVIDLGKQKISDYTELLEAPTSPKYAKQEENLLKSFDKMLAENNAQGSNQLDGEALKSQGYLAAFTALAEAGVDITTGAHVVHEEYFDKGKSLGEHAVFHNPQRDAPCFTVAVDFPGIMVDRGQFYGKKEGGPKLPYRMYWGGEFYNQVTKKKYVDNYISYKNSPQGKQQIFAFGPNSVVTKMGAAASILDTNGFITKERVVELIGTSMYFTVKVSRSDSGWFNERIGAPVKLPKGTEVSEPDEDKLFYISLNPTGKGATPNEDWAISNLRATVVNSIMASTDYEGSELQADMLRLGKDKGQGDNSSTPAAAPQVKTPVVDKTDLPKEVDQGSLGF